MNACNKTKELNNLARLLETGLSNEIKKLNKYIDNFCTEKWSIFSDYCIGQKGYPNNTMAFTITPAGKYFLSSNEIDKYLKRDLKDCKINKPIEPEAIAFLKSPRFFHFIFALEPRSKFITKRDQAQLILANALEIMENWPNAKDNLDIINRTKEVKKKQCHQVLGWIYLIM